MPFFKGIFYTYILQLFIFLQRQQLEQLYLLGL